MYFESCWLLIHHYFLSFRDFLLLAKEGKTKIKWQVKLDSRVTWTWLVWMSQLPRRQSFGNHTCELSKVKIYFDWLVSLTGEGLSMKHESSTINGMMKDDDRLRDNKLIYKVCMILYNSRHGWHESWWLHLQAPKKSCSFWISRLFWKQ